MFHRCDSGFDVYSPEPETLNDDERYAKILFDRATSVTGFVSVPQFEAVARKVGLEIVASVDYSNTLQDFTVKMARRSRKFFLSKSLYVRLVRWLLPLEVRKNAIMGLLVDVTTRHGVHSYHLHVFRKQA